jgi:hypothetical protein
MVLCFLTRGNNCCSVLGRIVGISSSGYYVGRSRGILYWVPVAVSCQLKFCVLLIMLKSVGQGVLPLMTVLPLVFVICLLSLPLSLAGCATFLYGDIFVLRV